MKYLLQILSRFVIGQYLCTYVLIHHSPSSHSVSEFKMTFSPASCPSEVTAIGYKTVSQTEYSSLGICDPPAAFQQPDLWMNTFPTGQLKKYCSFRSVNSSGRWRHGDADREKVHGIILGMRLRGGRCLILIDVFVIKNMFFFLSFSKKITFATLISRGAFRWCNGYACRQ